MSKGGDDDVFELFTIKTPRKKAAASETSLSSELVDEVFVKPKSSVSTPSKSETKSYRDKINERFRSVKEKAGKSSRRANFNKDSTERLRFEKARRDSKYIDEELELRKKKGRKLPKNDDFFNNESCIIDKSTDNLTEAKESELEFIKPEAMALSIRVSEEEMLFRPKAGIVPIVDKIDGSERNLEEEGFYVLKPPKIPSERLNLIENRLSKDSKKWFNCEGKLEIMEDPTKNSSFRPCVKSSNDEIALTLPTLRENLCEEIVVVQENILIVHISRLKFTHHPFFSLEHVLAEKLSNLFAKYTETIENNSLIRLEARVESLRQVLKASPSEKQESCRENVNNLQEKLFNESKKHRQVIKSILDTWKSIKKIRQANSFSNTTLKLSIRKEKVDFVADKRDFDKKLERVLDDYLPETESDRENLETIIRRKFTESFRPPGEPLVFFTLSEDNATSKNVADDKENLRRNAISSTRVALRIICGKIEVCKTNWMSLSEDFSVDFEETVKIQLSSNQFPKNISIEILEQTRSLVRKTRGEAYVALPRLNRTNSSRLSKFKFEKDEIIRCNKHSGVGSGVPLKDSDAEETSPKISGFLTCKIFWEKSSMSEKSSRTDFSANSSRIVDKFGKIHLDKLSEWMDQTKPDPQDPKNSILYEYSPDENDKDVHFSAQTNNFRLNPYMSSLVFVDQSVLEENLRLKFLQLRNAHEPEFDGVPIPNRIKEQPLHLYENYKKRVVCLNNEAENKNDDDDDESDDELEKKRMRGRQSLKQIHVKVFQKCKNSQHNLTFEDVVDEKFLHYFEKMIKGVIENVVNWFKWRPALHQTPLPHFEPSSSLIPNGTTQTRLVINVISAQNLPAGKPNSDSSKEIKPFIEIEYNNVTVQVQTSCGTNPVFNEIVSLPLESVHVDYLNPNSMNGNVVLRIFDETDCELAKFDNMKKKTYLGFVEFSISAVTNDGLRGMFRVIKPNMFLGYQEIDFDKFKKTPRTNESNSDELINESFLNMQVALEPNVPKLSPSIEELPCSDLPYIKEHCLKWNENFNANFPNRKFSAFVIDSSGCTTCITRYIRPLEPPQINLQGFDVTPEQCARYVSLIPFTDCSHFYQNICLSLNEFLKIMIGSVLDHAIALTCYLLSLKVDAWLLLGLGLPRGSSAFVFVKEHNPTGSSNGLASNCYIFDVVTAAKINLTDALCPLQRIFCLVNEKNVWGNIQRNENVSTMRFDLNRRSDWWPLFDNKITAPTNSVQGIVRYTPPKCDVTELEIRLDRKIRKSLTKLRQFDRTVWNHNVSNAIKTALCSFENSEMYRKSSVEGLEKIRECVATHEINGCVVCLPFSSISAIAKTVRSFGVYFDEDPLTEFATAVYIKPYPGCVLAVWVFVGTTAAVSERIVYVAWKNKILGYVSKTGLLCTEFTGIKESIAGFTVHYYESNECITACSTSGEVTTWKTDTCFKVINKKISIPRILNFHIIPAENGQLQSVLAYRSPDKTKFFFVLYEVTKDIRQNIKFSLNTDSGEYFMDVSSNKYVAIAHNQKLTVIKIDSSPPNIYHHNSSANRTLTCITCHPEDEMILTGDSSGRAILWQNIFNKNVVKSIFHWHTLPTRCIAFSSAGSSFYSGGEECVLVRWQIENKTDKAFLPRISAYLRQITVSPLNVYVAVATDDNAIKIINSYRDAVSLIQHLVIGDQLDTGIVIDPRTKSLVMNGIVGHVQFYSPNDQTLLYNLDVVGGNKFTNERDVKLENTQVRKIAVSQSGQWLGTVEERRDDLYSGEIRLKFWNFDAEVQNFRLNTSIEYPHEKSVNAILFQPAVDEDNLLCVTVGGDGVFKVWRLEDSSTIYRKGNSWVFLCSGFYRDLLCKSASFTIDGSLVAVSFNQIVTAWIPDNCELKCSLVHPLYKEEINQIHFGIQNQCHLLVTASEQRLSVWNILTLTMIWTVPLKISHLIADTVTVNMAVFTGQGEVFVFTPNSPNPVFSNKTMLDKHSVEAAAFMPSKFSNDVRLNWYQRSPIIFLDQNRELYSIGIEDELGTTALSIENEYSLYSQMLPKSKSNSIEVSKPVQHLFTQDSAQKNIKKFLEAPLHTMIPIRVMCGTLLKSLILQKTN